jgi:hypothetical protein
VELLPEAARAKDTRKEVFIKYLMEEPTLCHERGHIRSFADMEPAHYALHNVFAEEENAGSVLLEMLADFAPGGGPFTGAFNYFIELAQKNQKLAAAQLCVYMSDYWFVSPEEPDYRPLLSFAPVSLALYFWPYMSQPECLPNMRRLRDIVYRLFQREYENLAGRLIDIITRALYEVPAGDGSVHETDFETLYQEVFIMYLSGVNARPMNELTLFHPFWINMAGYLKKWSREGWARYEAALREAYERLEHIVLDFINSSETEK